MRTIARTDIAAESRRSPEATCRRRAGADGAAAGPARACDGAFGPRAAVAHGNENGPPLAERPVQISRLPPTLPGPRGLSTIGAEGLNCSVRNGKRCLPLAITTEKLRDRAPAGAGTRRSSAGA